MALLLLSACAEEEAQVREFLPDFDPPVTQASGVETEPLPFAQGRVAKTADILAPSYRVWDKIGEVTPGTPVGIYGFDHSQDLALISPWGHTIPLSALEHSNYDGVAEAAGAAAPWTGVLRRSVGGRPAGTQVGVWAFSTTDKHGGWVVLGGPGRIEVVSARDVVVEGLVVLDGHYSDDRIEMLEVLSDGIGSKFPTGFNGPWAGNVWAGNINQTIWQRDSGRHPVDPATGHATGWWGKANNVFVVWPLVSAIADGHPAFENVRVIQDPDVGLYPEDMCHGTPCTELWMVAIDEIDEQYQRFQKGEITTPEEQLESTRRIHEEFWLAHTLIADVAVERTSGYLPTLPKMEQEFVIAWGAVMVHFLGEANFPLTRPFQESFNPILPQSFVTEAGLYGGPEGKGDGTLNPLEIAVAKSALGLSDANTATGGVLLWTFGKAADELHERDAFEGLYRAMDLVLDGGCWSTATCNDEVDALMEIIKSY